MNTDDIKHSMICATTCRQKGSIWWGAEPSLSERLAVYLLLAHTLTEAAKIPEATKVTSETPMCKQCQVAPAPCMYSLQFSCQAVGALIHLCDVRV